MRTSSTEVSSGFLRVGLAYLGAAGSRKLRRKLRLATAKGRYSPFKRPLKKYCELATGADLENASPQGEDLPSAFCRPRINPHLPEPPMNSKYLDLSLFPPMGTEGATTEIRCSPKAGLALSTAPEQKPQTVFCKWIDWFYQVTQGDVIRPRMLAERG